MVLPLPQLDNRSFDELLREGRRVLPRRAPRWTDHNDHDPGITLIELLSWLVELDMYRLDRTTDAARRAMLRLLGIEPRSPQVAATVVELGVAAGTGAVMVPAGTVIRPRGAASSTEFETIEDRLVPDARLVALTGGPDADGEDDLTASNDASGTTYPPFSAQPQPGSTLVLGLDARPGEPGQRMALHVWTADHEADDDTRERLLERHREQLAAAGHRGADAAARVPDWRSHYWARLAWEYLATNGQWSALPGLEDETRALTLSGFVRFVVPSDWAATVGSGGVETYELRARLVAGGYECPPWLDRIGLHAVAARHAVLVAVPERLGRSDATAGQRFDLRRTPVVAGSVELGIVPSAGGLERWQEVAQWDRVGPHDRSFRLEPERGRVCFGDGRIGRVPEADAEIAARYRVGGGEVGNVPAEHLVRASGLPSVTVTQPFAARGGAAAEDIVDAQVRAIEWFEQRFRAVTLEDFETLALQTPGVPVARARALAGLYPPLRSVIAAGCVTVVVVPHCPSERPEPSAELLEAVKHWLEPRRPLTTELHVIGPCFQSVAVHARLHPDGSVPRDELLASAQAALELYFDAFEGGPDGTGWPVGRDVHRAEVIALLGEVPGVAFVDGFGLQGDGDQQPRCDNLEICSDCLAVSGDHQLEVVDDHGSCASFEWTRSRVRR